jgi:regulator of replication initiation timing
MYVFYPLPKQNAKLGTEISSLKESLKEREEQLQVLGVQRASLETSLFELEKEVEEDKKQIEDKWKKEVDSVNSLFEKGQMVSGCMLYSINENGKCCTSSC